MNTHTQSWVSMIRTTKRLAVVFVCVLLMLGMFASRAHAAAGVPRIMNYQGRLMNLSGTLLGGTGTDYCVKFALYDDAVIGGADTKVWPSGAPSTMTVVVRNGIFNAGVGDTNAGGDTLDFNFEDNDAVYLNVEVATKVGATCAPGDGAESFENLSPRQRVTSSGYAINSATVGGRTANYLLANSFSTTSATVFVNATTSIPKTYVNNTFIGVNTFADITVTNATIASTTLGSATSTNLNVNSTFSGAGLTSCSGSNDKLVWNATTRQFGCDTDLSGSGGADGNWTFFNNTGIRPATTSNQVLVGGTATTSLAKFEAQGGAKFDNATSTTLNTSILGLGGSEYFTSLIGTGLQNVGGILTLNSGGDWTGTFDGQEGAYYLANSFSTTSASNFASVGLAFSTTSVDFWKTQNNFFSTTSAAYNLSTYDKGYFFSTTSVAFWDSTQFRWATTSSDAWFATKDTDDLPEGSTNFYYADSRVNAFVGASTTIPKTFGTNTFTGTNNFQNVTATGVTSTASFTETASSSNLFSGIANISSLIATAITGNTITAVNATSTTLYTNFSSSTETRANTASFGSATFGSTTVAATSTTNGLFASFSRILAALVDSLTASVLTAFNATVGNLTATSSATLASTTAYGRFITGNVVATSSAATSTFAGSMIIGTSSGSYKVSVLGNITAPSGATGTAIMAISNDDSTLSSGNNVLRLNIRTPYGTACTSGTTCPRFIEYFAAVPSGSDTGGRGVGSLRLSTAGTGITQTSGAADFAEYMQLSESALVGDIVSLNSSGEYRKATAGEALIGVVSNNAAFVGNGNLEGEPNAYIVGFAGVIQTTVSDANGDIDAGDLIAASDVPGVGIKLSESGYALGQALQSFSGPGEGTITVLVMPKFVDAAIVLESYGGGASGDSGYWTLSTSTNTVSLASSTYAVAIQGSASTSNLVVSNGFTFGKATGVLKSVAGVVSSSLLNLAADVTGVLGISNGGTGTSTAPTYGRILVGNNVGGYDLVATSSLGLGAGSPVWGAITGTLSAQTDLQNALDMKLSLSQWYATTTDALVEGAANKYYADARVQTYLNGVDKGFFFSTTSASNFASVGLAFSTTSAAYFNSVNPGASFSTTSADFWKTQNNFFSTTSAAYNLSTYDKGYFFSTTSVAFWDSTQFRWATTSSDAWFATKSTSNLAEGSNQYYTASRVAGVIAGTTTDALAEGSTNKYYSNGLVDAHIGASTTVAKTFTNNTFTGVNAFQNITATGATTTVLSTGIASTSNLTISNIQNSMLYTGGNGIAGGVTVNGPLSFSAGSLSVQQAGISQDGYLSSGDYSSLNGRLSTSSLGLFDKGFFFSTTSASVFSAAGLSFSTTSTDYWKLQNNFFSTTSASHFTSLGLAFSTTSTAYFLSQNQGAAFSTTSANHYIYATAALPKTDTNNTFTGTNSFQNIAATGATTTSFAATTASTSQLFSNAATIGSATIGALTTTATSSGANGFDITDGCFSIDGVCIASEQGGGGSGELIAIQTFTSGTSTYTPSAGATSAQVIVTGAGGGGGGADSDGATVEVPAGGAGAGATSVLYVDLTATTSVQVVVGAGGTGGTAAAGGTGLTGGHSSFGPELGRAGGGNGGVGAVSADSTAGPRTLAGGSGGSATAGDVQIAGGNGQDGNSQAVNTAFGGTGGASYWGGGGDGGSVVVTATQSAGSNATAYGAGGGGAALADTATGAAGGNGSNGIVVVYEYGPFQGTMAVTNGGTGLSSGPSYGQLLMGNGAGGYVLVATSSLGLATTTDSLTEGVQNLYYTDARVNAYVGASTTIAKSFTANIFTALQTFANAIFNNATSTNFAVTGVASSSNLVASNSFTLGKVTGILKATAGSVVAALVDLTSDITGVLGIGNGGTGTSTAPTLGQLLVGNAASGYDLVATSTLGIYISDTLGTLDETRGGTGNTSYSAGDILYALNGSTLVPLPVGSNGSVLKIAGGLPAWGTDLQSGGGGGGGAGFFSTTTDELAIYPSNPAYTVIVGNTATATSDSMLEVFGKSYFSNRMGIATSAPGSIFSIGNVANFSSLGSSMYTKLNLIDVQATGDSAFVNVLAANLAAASVGAGSLSAGTIATTTIQGDATGTSTIQGFINVTGTNSTSTFSGNVAVLGNLQALSIRLTATSSAAGINMESGCYAINGVCTVNSLTATNTTLTVSPGSGAVGISLNLSNPNVWSGLQQFGNASSSRLEATQLYARTIQSTSTNALVLQSNVSSTAGLTFGSTSTPQVLGIDTINNRVTLGTGGGTPSLLVLDNKNTPGDPTGVAGAQYYNSNADEFRCFVTSWMTCGGQAASSTGNVQYRNVDGSFTANANFTWSIPASTLVLTGASSTQTTDILAIASSSGRTMFAVNGMGVMTLATTTDPAAPSSGELNIYAKEIANRIVPKWIGPSGVDTPFQSAIWQNNLTYFNPGAAAGVWTGTVGSPLGTQAIVLPTTTNFFTSMRRSRFSSVVTTLNQQVGTRSDAMFFRGGSAGQGGFFFAARIGFDTWTANDRLFVGLSSGTTAVCTVNPTTLVNTIGFSISSASTSISFITNDGAGNATEASTIPGQPALASQNGYAMYMFAKPNDTVVYWQIDNINTGLKIAEGQVSTDLPVNTTMLSAHACMSNASNTAVNAAQLGINRIYIETDR